MCSAATRQMLAFTLQLLLLELWSKGSVGCSYQSSFYFLNGRTCCHFSSAVFLRTLDNYIILFSVRKLKWELLGNCSQSSLSLWTQIVLVLRHFLRGKTESCRTSRIPDNCWRSQLSVWCVCHSQSQRVVPILWAFEHRDPWLWGVERWTLDQFMWASFYLWSSSKMFRGELRSSCSWSSSFLNLVSIGLYQQIGDLCCMVPPRPYCVI